MAQEKSQIDDAELVAQAIEELPYVTRSYQLLAGRYYPLVLRYCVNLLREQAEAEDACQVILLKVLRGLPRFQGRSSFKTWLFRIAANTCYSQMQKLKRERERFARLDQETLDSTVETNPTNFQTLRNDRFENMIASLSEQEQHLLGLRFIGELSLDEIAGIMGLGISATKMRFYRALKKLDSQLKSDKIEQA